MKEFMVREENWGELASFLYSSKIATPWQSVFLFAVHKVQLDSDFVMVWGMNVMGVHVNRASAVVQSVLAAGSHQARNRTSPCPAQAARLPSHARNDDNWERQALGAEGADNA